MRILKFLAIYCIVGTAMAGTITLSSERHSALLYPMWCQGFYSCGQATYFVINGSRPSQEPLQLLEWKVDQVLSIFQSTPREDLYDAYSLAMTPDCHQLFMGSYNGGLTYRFDLSGDFKRLSIDGALSEQLFFYQNRLVRSSRKGKPILKPLNGEPLTGLSAISQVLAQDKRHPVEDHNNFNRTVLTVSGDRMAICYSMYDRIRVFNLKTGALEQTIPIGRPFPSYQPPPPDYPVKRGQDYRHRVMTWNSSFHSLQSLRFRAGQVFGLFRKGFDTQGVWVAFDQANSFYWDNDKEQTKLLDIQEKRYFLATVNGLEEEEVLWTLWDSLTLPGR